MRHRADDPYKKKKSSWKLCERHEWRLFLLYTGKTVLKSILLQELYEHVMVLGGAIYIFVGHRLTGTQSVRHKLLT